ncbi:hypothetical protein Mame01_12660 [Microbispora amethystogenes]|nr:hypothetical protein Mame01_12660 [Microbispora amethystogenes]
MNGSTIVPRRFTNEPPNSTQNGRGRPPALDRRNPVPPVLSALPETVVTPITVGHPESAVRMF